MRVAVLGAGTMGAGVAQLAAMHGHEVTARDVTDEQLDRARASIATSLERFARKDRLVGGDDAAAVEARLTLTTDLAAAVRGADVVIEAVPEVLELKHEVLAQALEHAPADALIGTNTSQLSITRIAAPFGDDAQRIVGVHFFNPPVMMRLVELIAGLLTSEQTVARAQEFAASLDRETVVCRKDSPGFITSRAYAILRLECLRMLEEGVATAEDIDKAMRLGFNFPMGPLELGDMNGLDTYLHAISALAEAHGDRFRPTVGLKNMVAAGRLGRKTGAGFYEYDDTPTRSTT
jgi:3-hydroxybutyryl-CoA dehydrogenase